MQITILRAEWKTLGSLLTPMPHPAVNGYRILARGCDLPSRIVTWHLPRRGVQGCQYKDYTHDPNSIVWSLYSVYIHNTNNYSI